MKFEQGEMYGEIDKAINIHAIASGHQIMLCKKRNITQNSPYIFLWPGEGEYTTDKNLFDRVYKNDLKNHRKAFLLSDLGSSYQKNHKIQVVSGDRQYTKIISTVEYHQIRPDRRMFEELRNCGEFPLWDIDNGPMRYFTRPNGQLLNSGYIAIYRAYKLPRRINHNDINFNTGFTPRLKSASFERVMGAIIDGDISPVEAVKIEDESDVLRRSYISGDYFEERNQKILNIIGRFQP